MLKSCSRCGRIHPFNYDCTVGKEWSKHSGKYDKLRNKAVWRRKREQIKADAFYLCEVCRDNRTETLGQLEVHHIEKLNERPELLLEDDNLICLCTEHHKQADRGELDKEYLRELARKRMKSSVESL